MHSYLAIGKLVVLCVALLALAVVRAEAGASASAPTKNQRSSQMAAHHQTGHNTPITEYSSSSARNRSH
jgi:hypothetical protein